MARHTDNNGEAGAQNRSTNQEDVTVTVDPDNVAVNAEHGRVDRRVVALLPRDAADARRDALTLEAPPDAASGISLDSLSFDDDRELPVHGFDGDDELPNPEDTEGVQPVTTGATRTSLRGRAVRVDEVSARRPDDRELYLADESGTCKVRLYGPLGIPEIRQGDRVVITDVERNEEDGGPAWEQTEDSAVVVYATSPYPAGYRLERRSRLVEAENWYSSKNDTEATRLVKVTLMNELALETPRGNGDMWMYVDDPDDPMHGTWTDVAEERIKTMLEDHLPERKINARTKGAVLSSIRDQTRVPQDEWDQGAPDTERLQWTVGVENGVIDLRTGDLHNHGPEWRLRQTLPIEYHPDEYDGLGDELDWFLGETMRGDEDRESFLYLLGHALARCYPAEAIWALTGPGRNGKTRLLELIDVMFGASMHDFSLETLAGDYDFGAKPLKGANVAIDDDASDVKLSQTGDLKKQSGGRGGMINVKDEQMDGDGYANYGTMAFLSNDPPMFNDKSDGMFRRMHPVIMPYKFTNNPADEHKDSIPKQEIRDRIQATNELEALLVVAVEYAGKLYRTSEVKDGRSEDERKELYKHYSDGILRFWSDCMTSEQGARVTRRAVYETAVNWCAENGVDPWSAGGRNGFWSLSDQCPAVSFNRNGVHLDGERAVEHVKFAPEAMEYAPDWVRSDWEEDVEGDARLANRLDRSTPLADLDGGYCTVQARVIARDYADRGQETGTRLTLEDDTTAIDLFGHGDELDDVHVGDEVRVERAVLSQSKSVPRLNLGAASAVEVTERGPGPSNETTSTEDTRDSALTETIDDSDDSTDEDERDVIVNVIDELNGANGDGASVEDVRDEVMARTGCDESDLDAAVDELMSAGEIYEPVSDVWRCT